MLILHAEMVRYIFLDNGVAMSPKRQIYLLIFTVLCFLLCLRKTLLALEYLKNSEC